MIEPQEFFNDRLELESWLKDKPVEWGQVIATRAALRVFPLIIAEGPVLTLGNFRSNFISWAACNYPQYDMGKVSNYAAVANSLDFALKLSKVPSLILKATTNATFTLAHIPDILPFDTREVYEAVSSAAQVVPDDNLIWRQSNHDASWLELNTNAQGLIRQPLWLEYEGDTSSELKVQKEIIYQLEQSAYHKTAALKNAHLIVDWYRALLPLDPRKKPHSFFGEKADLTIAMQPKEFWERGKDDEGVEAVLSDIAKIVKENPRNDGSLDKNNISKTSLQRDDADPHSDEATAEDELGRRGFALRLVDRLNRVRDAGQGDGFAVHLHAPWGAGKSSLFLMMQEYMAASSKNGGTLPSPDKDWIVVNFNAWQHEHRVPPWWPLIEAVKRDCSLFWLGRLKDVFSGKFNRKDKKELPKTMLQSFIVFLSAFKNINLYTCLFRWKWLQYRWWKWKFKADWAPYVLAIFILGGMLLYSLHSTDTVKNIPTYVKALTALGGIFAAFATLTHRLVFGNSDDAKFYFQLTSNPLGQIQTLFQKIINTTNRPVCIFIDDLDRCNADFTVDLLEGIQTSFRHPKVTYVVAADKAWIRSVFETRYQSFAPHVGEKEMPLGYLFLEKIFQMSTPLPGISDDVKQDFFDNLLGTTKLGEAKENETIKEVPANLNQAPRFDRKVAEHVEKISTKYKDGFDTNVAAEELKEDNTPEKRAAVAQILDDSPGAEEEANHLLSQFASLLSGNPREMKRLLNAYGMRRSIHFLEYSLPQERTEIEVNKADIAMETLFRWTIIEQTYPALADILIEQPQLIDHFNGMSDNEPPKLIKPFMHLDKVKEIVSENDLPMITADIIRLITKGSST